MNEEIQLEDFKLSLYALWKYKSLIISISVLTFLIGLVITVNQKVTDTYSGKCSIYSASSRSFEESSSGTKAMLSYKDIIKSSKVCEQAMLLMGEDYSGSLDKLKSMIQVDISNDSIINIYAYSEDANLAVKASNAVSEAFIREIAIITGYDTVQILDHAEQAVLSSSGKKEILKIRLLFLIAGFIVSSGCIVIKELFSDKLRTVAQCRERGQNEILAIIPMGDKEK